MEINLQASKKSKVKPSKQVSKASKKPNKALKEAARIIGSLGGRPRKDTYG